MPDRFETPFGSVTLARAARDLRPWDAADAYALRYLAGELAPAALPEGVPSAPLEEARGDIIVVEDATGALTLPLTLRAQRAGTPAPVLLADSHLAALALAREAKANSITAPDFAPAFPSDTLSARRFGLAVVRAPRSVALFRYLLERLRAALRPGALVVVTGMTKHLPPTARDVLTRAVGSASTLRVWKKAVLLVARLGDPEPDADALAPTCFELPEAAAAPDAPAPTVCAYPGVFAGDRLDAGTRMLLEPLRAWIRRETPARIADVGCGNGVLALAAKLTAPEAEVAGFDASHLAIASARATFARNGLEAQFAVTDGLSGEPDAAFDLVVSNPPFHIRGALNAAPALRLLAESSRALRPGGALLVVGIHRLGYAPALRERFAHVEALASDRTYGVWLARGRAAA